MYIVIICGLLLIIAIIYIIKKYKIENFYELIEIEEGEELDKRSILLDNPKFTLCNDSLYIDQDIELEENTYDIYNENGCLLINFDNTIYGDPNCDTIFQNNLNFNSNVFFDNIMINSNINFNNNLVINSNIELNDICYNDNCLKEKLLNSEEYDNLKLKEKIEKIRGIRYKDENDNNLLITENTYINNLNNFINS